jgi:signal transduction histidine kinase
MGVEYRATTEQVSAHRVASVWLLSGGSARARVGGRRRRLAQGILPSVLARGGLAASVEELTERLRLPISVQVARDRFSPEIEANAYFVVAEALTNLAKHSRARSGAVAAWVEDKQLHVDISDDGVGGARPDGGGLRGLADRVAALGGQVQIDSRPGCGTQVTATLPLE